MKSRIKRILAVMLCLSMILNGSISLSAQDDLAEEPQIENEVVEEEIIELDKNIVEKEALVLSWSKNGVTVTVSEKVAGSIPEGSSLQVTPITSGTEYANVESGLQEKASSESYEIAGFLAYDICLIDASGNEIEPNDNVNVSIVYDKAVMPEMEVAENAELDVTVMHFEEDANGTVTEIVDMVADEKAEAIVTTTDAVEVEKAEFVTDSFSTYTVTWRYISGNTWNTLSVNGKTILQDGVEIGTGNLSANGNSYNSTLALSNVNFIDITDNNITYSYKKTVICSGSFYSSASAQDVTSITYNNGTYTASTSSGSFVTVTDSNLYFIYAAPEPLHEVETVDHSGTGIVMRMIDYNVSDNDYTNSGRDMFGLGAGWGDSDASINWYLHGIKAGLVKNVLNSEGYPETSSVGYGKTGRVPNRSLKDAFEGGIDVNHLFIKETYENTGYYEYSSLENYAYLNSDGNFTVYEELGTPASSGADTYYNRGNFFPYNPIVAGELSACQNLYDVNENELTGERAGEALYKTQGDTNYLFGMYLEVPFVQPKDGQVEITKGGENVDEDMKYEFVGDDDLWIFIDNVLVLDIGGIHDARGGQINFATGEVTYDRELQDTTIKAMFRTAGIFPDGSVWEESRAGEYFEGETFADYSSHTMKMFYMERGKGASNLSVKFNIPPVAKESVTVRKELTNYAAGAYSDVEFSYKLYLGEQLEQITDENLVPAGTAYILVKADGTRVPAIIKADGTFVLKHNEQAVFEDVAEIGTKYIVQEVGISSETYDKVEISSTGIVNEEDTNISGSENSVSTRPLEVGKDFLVLFKNTCAVSNMKHIVIKKVLGGNSEESFAMRVSVAGLPYTGAYKVGSDYDSALASNETLYATSEGIISLKANEVAVVMGYITRIDNDKTVYGIPSGTSFRVEEIGLDESLYAVPTYTVTTETADNVAISDDYNGYAAGVINLGNNPEVTVLNAMKSSLTIKKEWISDATTYPSVYVGLYNKADGMPAADSVRELNSDNSYQTSFIGYSVADYTAKELRPIKENETAEFTITVNGVDVGLIGINPETESIIMVDDNTYRVEYVTSTEDETITIKNTQLGKITITKISSSDERLKLQGAEFELYIYDEEQEKYVTTGRTVTTGVDGLAFFDNLEKGLYKIVETKAPAGYALSTQEYEISIPTVNETTVIYDVDQEITNTPLYELPSAGGFGIYFYMFGGMMLMVFATFVLYNNRRKVRVDV